MHNYYSEPGFFGGGKCARSVIVLCYSSMQYEMDIYNITLNYYPNDIWYLRRRYDLNCKSANVVYRLECILCGLVYVGETKGKLHKRYAVIDPVSLTMLTILFYQHFNQPDHSILSMWVRIVGVLPTRAKRGLSIICLFLHRTPMSEFK
jgi:hypothetical protein